MAASGNYVDFNDTYGLMTVTTLNNNIINCFYNYYLSTFNDIVNGFFNNYECKNIKNDSFFFFNSSTENSIPKSDYKKTPKELNIPVISHFKLSNSMYCEFPPTIPTNVTEHVAQLKKDAEEHGMPIFLQSLTGRSRTQMICSSFTVIDLKLLIQDMDGIPVQHSRLVYAGHSLDNNKTMADYNIQSGSTVHIVLTFRGGMYHETSGKNGDFKPLTNSVIWIGVEPKEFVNKVDK